MWYKNIQLLFYPILQDRVQCAGYGTDISTNIYYCQKISTKVHFYSIFSHSIPKSSTILWWDYAPVPMTSR